MTGMYKLTKDGNGIVYIPEDTVAPNLQCVVDDLNDMSEQLAELKTAFGYLGVPLDLMKDFAEWDNMITKLDTINRELIKTEETYLLESQRIISEAQENEVDFKALYGANNKDTRQQYADEQLEVLLSTKRDMEFMKADYNRRIPFIKRIIDLKIQLIKYDKNVEVH